MEFQSQPFKSGIGLQPLRYRATWPAFFGDIKCRGLRGAGQKNCVLTCNANGIAPPIVPNRPGSAALGGAVPDADQNSAKPDGPKAQEFTR
jgi:hypothetical protein